MTGRRARPDHVETALAFGDWIWAVFPQMAGKRRPGVLIAAISSRGAPLGVAIPATAQPGHKPGALAISAPPALGLRPCRLIIPYMSALRLDRLEPLGSTLSETSKAALEALILEFYGSDWRRRPPPAASGLVRIKPRSVSQRRRFASRRAALEC